MTTPRERLILDGRVPTAATIRDRILNRIVDGVATIKEEQITALTSSTLKYGFLHSNVQTIDKITGTQNGYDIVFEEGTDYELGTGVDADTIVFYSSKTPDEGTSFWVDYTYQDTIVSGITKKEVGGVTWIFMDTVGQIIAEMYGNFAYFANQTFVDTATDTYLDFLASLVGVTRQTATKSVGVVTVTNNSGSSLTINSGAMVSTVPKSGSPAVNVVFAAGHVLGNGSSANYDVEAESAGNIGIGKNKITRIVSGFSVTNGVTIANSDPVGGGSEEETDEELRIRIKISFDYAGESNRATRDAIRSSLLDVAGVETCYVYDRWYCVVNSINDISPEIKCNGMAFCFIMLESRDDIYGSPIKVQQMTEANPTKAALRTAAETARAAGCAALLLDIQDVLIDIELTCEAKSGYVAGDVKTEIETAIETYLNETKEIGDDIYKSEITSLIYALDGVKENSITCNIYEAIPMARVGHTFNVPMWSAGTTKAAPLYITVYDCATGTTTSSTVTFTFTYRDENWDIQTDGAAQVTTGTSQWTLIDPTTPATTSDTRAVESISATGTTDGDKYEFRTRRTSDWIRIGAMEKVWKGILNIIVT